MKVLQNELGDDDNDDNRKDYDGHEKQTRKPVLATNKTSYIS